MIVGGRVSEAFCTGDGLRQGGGLSPLLFIIYMNDIIEICEKKSKKFHVGYRNLQSIQISSGAFADDLIILAGSKNDLQTNINSWHETMKTYDMIINKKKTKVMIIGDENETLNIHIDNDKIEQVKTYKYLGVEIAHDGKYDTEINSRINSFMKVYNLIKNDFLNNRYISNGTKMRVFQSICRPILTFGCESWVLEPQQKSRIQAAEMTYLRRVKKITRMDRVRNEVVRQELGSQSVLDYIEQRQLAWWGHLQRMSPNRTPKQIWEARISGNRRRGRPRKSWDNIVTDIFKKRKITYKDARESATNKKKWAQLVYTNYNRNEEYND